MYMKKIILSLSLFLAHSLNADISVLQDGTELQIQINGKLFTEYRTDRHVPCLYPLMSPDGTHLTRQFPFQQDIAGEQSDHPHHIGFWFAHGSVNGYDFWHGRKGEKIVTTRLHHTPPEEVPGGARISFLAALDWIAEDKVVLREERTYTITQRGTDRIIDVSCRLKATEGDVIFGDTKEGSFALRVAPTMRLKGEIAQGGITNSNGNQGADSWGKRAKWVAYYGPDSTGTPTVAAIFDHPNNLRHPTWWHARDYGLLTANPFGARAYGGKASGQFDDYQLKQGEVLTLQYRLLLHQGELGTAQLDERWSDFSQL